MYGLGGREYHGNVVRDRRIMLSNLPTAVSLRDAVLQAGGTLFSPTNIAGLQLWLKADAGTYQSSGGSAATADNDPIGEWQDQSVNAKHAVETTNKPVLKLNIQNMTVKS